MTHVKVTVFWLLALTVLVLLWQHVTIPRPNIVWPPQVMSQSSLVWPPLM
jgi:hypothetical protein